jgi:hypothetical protein
MQAAARDRIEACAPTFLALDTIAAQGALRNSLKIIGKRVEQNASGAFEGFEEET